MGLALEGRRKAGGIPVPARVSAAPSRLGSIPLTPRVPLRGFRRSAAPWATIHSPFGTEPLTRGLFPGFATETSLGESQKLNPFSIDLTWGDLFGENADQERGALSAGWKASGEGCTGRKIPLCLDEGQY